MRWVLRILIAIIAVLMVAAGAGYAYLRTSLPKESGSVLVTGLQGSVEIVRDRYGIPHIYAQTVEDAYFALGFVHAQDRLWQMETHRRIAAGRLSEVLGAATLDTDRFLRTIGIRHHAERSFDHLADEVKRGFSAYAAGVNQFLATRSGAPPPEFLLLGVSPEPWTPADSLGWVKMMAWDLSGNWFTELSRLRLSQRLSPAQIAEFFPPYPGDPPLTLPDLAQLYRAAAAQLDIDGIVAAVPSRQPEGIGSNNWVVHGSRTASGKPLLANDPHLGLSTPAIWYFAHLTAPGLNVIGATLPGVPGVVLGRNDAIAWGMTNTGPDTQDLFIERLAPDDPGRYLTPDGAVPFATRDEVIGVKGQDPVRMTVRLTRHGPVISDVSRPARDSVDQSYAVSFAWTALRDDDQSAQAIWRIALARDWTGFVDALRSFHSPQQNFVYADVAGNIGFIAPGRIPVRSPANDLKGLAPAPGWDARYDWTGFVPFDELPRALNPRSGRIVTANHKIVGPGYPHHLTSEWAEPYRATRIERLLLGREAHTRESFEAIQGDVMSLMALDLLPPMLAALPGAARDPDARAARDLLAGWDGSAWAERPEPLLFALWYRELTRLVYADEIGDLFAANWRQRPIFMHNVLTDRGGQSRWCDDVRSPEVETCQTMIVRALDLALADGRARYGDNLQRWRWGDAHVARGTHRPFSNVELLAPLFESRVRTPGDTYTVNVGRYNPADESHPFVNVHAASLRAIYDFADLDRSLFIHSTGQSGNILSDQYNDFAPLWQDVEYVPMTTRRAEISVGARGTLVLRPR